LVGVILINAINDNKLHQRYRQRCCRRCLLRERPGARWHNGGCAHNATALQALLLLVHCCA